MPPKRRSDKLNVEYDRTCSVAATGDGAATRSLATTTALAVAAEQSVDFGRDGVPRLFTKSAGTVARTDSLKCVALSQNRT